MLLRAVLFDLWDTLISDAHHGREPARLRLQNVQSVLHKAGVHVEEPVLRQAYRATMAELSELHDRALDISSDDQIRIFLSRLGPALGSDLSPDLFESVRGAYTSVILQVKPIVKEGAAQTLGDLKRRGLRLGLVSNTGTTPGSTLRKVLQNEGLIAYFDAFSFSDEVGMCKPARGMFLDTLAKLETKPEEAVFVGDKPILDVEGPQHAGLVAVQIGDNLQDGIRPQARIGQLPELIPALESLGYRFPTKTPLGLP
ncbi:MAG: HAD family hydrolase [Dehalococcoidia bacterium]